MPFNRQTFSNFQIVYFKSKFGMIISNCTITNNNITNNDNLRHIWKQQLKSCIWNVNSLILLFKFQFKPWVIFTKKKIVQTLKTLIKNNANTIFKFDNNSNLFWPQNNKLTVEYCHYCVLSITGITFQIYNFVSSFLNIF